MNEWDQQQDGELSRKIEEELKEISDGDQNKQAVINLAGQCATLYKALVEEGLEEEVALSITEHYVEAVIGTLMGK